MKNTTSVERTSERELVVRRLFNGPPQIVFDAWTKPDLLMRWWAPKSFGITFVSCEIDLRTEGSYRFVFSHPDFPEPMAFFGRYVEVTPPSRIVWTNEESDDGAISTVTFEAQGEGTLLVLHEIYPSKEALDEALASGASGTAASSEQFAGLDDVLVTLANQ